MFKAKINFLLIVHFVSLVMIFESLFMLLSVIVSLIYNESTTFDLLLSFGLVFTGGLVLNLLTRKQIKEEPHRKESIIIVSLGWIILGLFGTLPYLLTGAIPSFTNAFFESISGFTTTGSSILADIEVLPKSVLFWRALTHWIGGMGIIVLVVAVMPFLQINGTNLFYSETSNVSDEKISVRIKYIARNLWLVYLGLTVVETILLYLGKMPLFDSICHSFATIATGGFSTKNASIGGYSNYIQYVVTGFMFLSGINFTLHVMAIKGDFRKAIKNEELHLYFAIILVATLFISFLLFFKNNIHFESAFRSALFQVVSVITATGFATADYLEWPVQAIFLIGLLMLIGASAGSTGGGVKVIRHLIAFKKIKESFRKIINPKIIRVIRYNDKSLDSNYISGVMSFIVFYYLILGVSTLIMMALGQDAGTSFGEVATSMAGIGPGFGTVGPASNFLHIPVVAKYFMTLLMIIGRLEIYAVLVVFTRSFWRA